MDEIRAVSTKNAEKKVRGEEGERGKKVSSANSGGRAKDLN